ncbi:MAG TPA: hypothetical protein VK066_29035 [Chloroflexota bacterium]|nr:hypothetical protein [Chloroflexota bacterium]
MVSQEPTLALSLQEALRTVGRVLEVRRPRCAYLTLDSLGVTVETPDDNQCRIYPWGDVARLSRAQLHYGRGQPSRHNPDAWSLTRWSVLLRTAGQLLDVQRVAACRIEARIGSASHESEVRATADGEVVLETLAVQLHWLRLRTRFDGREPHGHPSTRPWWRRWRFS